MKLPWSGWTATRVAAVGLAAVCVGLGALAELWFIAADQPLGFDEGYIGALALRLLDGHMLPGVDGVGQRGPVFYWTTTLAQALFGRYHWTGLRVLGAVDACAVVLALLLLGRLARKPLGGALAGAFFVFVLFHVDELGAGFAVNGEHLVAPLLCWATVLTGLSLRADKPRARVAYAAGGGFLCALAAWTKITMFVGIAPLALWVLADSAREPARPLRSHARALLPLLVGWLVPSLLVVAIYAAASAFDDLVYRFFTYNSQVYMGVYSDVRLAREVGQWVGDGSLTAYSWLIVTLALVAYLGYLAGSARRSGVVAALTSFDLVGVALLQALIGYGAGIAQMRFWPHHFIAGLPWAGLLLGLALDAALAALRPRWKSPVSLALAIAVAVGLLGTVGRDVRKRERERKAGRWRPAREDAICGAIQRWSKPEDYVFVWGFDGDINVSCERRPATRFVYSTLVAGIVPPFWRQVRPERIARDAHALTLLDLQRTKPALILDMPGKLRGQNVTIVPGVAELLARDYCKLKKVVGRDKRRATFYARKDLGFCRAKRPPHKKARPH